MVQPSNASSLIESKKKKKKKKAMAEPATRKGPRLIPAGQHGNTKHIE